jgi:hypothetical protein
MFKFKIVINIIVITMFIISMVGLSSAMSDLTTGSDNISIGFDGIKVDPKKVLPDNSGPPSYSGMINSATLYLRFCLIEQHICIERKADTFGQVCDPNLANLIGTGKESGYEGSVLPFFHYAGWRCELENPNDKPPYGTESLAK